jgi:hypothetical protein
MYLLNNFAALDVTFSRRYAVELMESGYVALDYADPEYLLFREIVERFQEEMIPMTCDIEAGLVAIADAIREAGASGGYCGPDVGSPTFNCIVNLDNDELLGPATTGHGVPYQDDPPDDFATWNEYLTYKCQAAEFIWSLERKHMVALKTFDAATLTAAIVGPVIAGVAGILPAAFTPPGFAVFVGSVVAIGAVSAGAWFYMDEMIEYWDNNHDQIVCALYSSGTSTQAVSGLANALEDAVQAIVTWGTLEGVAGSIAELLGGAFAQLAGNGIVEPLFKATVAATNYSADCSECDDPVGGLLITSASTPYNVVEVGDIIQFGDESSANGWASVTGGDRVEFGFTCVANIQSVRLRAYLSAAAPPSYPVGLAIWNDGATELIAETEEITVTDSPPGTTLTDTIFEDVNLEEGTDYELHLSKTLGENNWVNRVILEEYVP